ncbi:MAG: hypothetical protein NTZ65_01335 [Candidatus Berkelbacteria bacterium]|nr:hypothetical protein [Candidatus Berkelbacteria bacterium]
MDDTTKPEEKEEGTQATPAWGAPAPAAEADDEEETGEEGGEKKPEEAEKPAAE